MGVIDMFLINHESIAKGFKEVLGVSKKAKEYIIKGYDDKLPTKYRIDKYTTVSKI